MITLAAILVGCGAEEGRLLRVVQTVPLADSSATLAVDPAGRHWLGRPGAVRLRDGEGAVRDLSLPGDAAPRVVGWIHGAAYLRLGGALLAVSAGADSLTAARGDFGDNPLLCEVRGRAVLQGARSGAVLGHDPASLQPVWAWPARGAPTTALAVSPQGDRVYQALDFDDGEGLLLTRDLQTGRELGAMEMDFPLVALVAADDGMLYGVGREARRAVVVALRPGGNEVDLVWRRPLPVAERDAPVRIAVADDLVVVWGRGESGGLRVLDTRGGEVVARTRTDPLDFSFGPAGELWALYPGELRKLQ